MCHSYHSIPSLRVRFLILLNGTSFEVGLDITSKKCSPTVIFPIVRDVVGVEGAAIGGVQGRKRGGGEQRSEGIRKGGA